MYWQQFRRGGYGGVQSPNVPTPVVDTLAPSTPLRIYQTPYWNGVSGGVKHCFIPSADVQKLSEPTAGLGKYIVEIAGVPQDVTATQANAITRSNSSNIGGAPGSGAWSDRQFTMVFGGGGLGTNGDPEQFTESHWDVDVSDWSFLCVDISSMVAAVGTPNAYSQFGLRIQKGTGVGAQNIMFDQFYTAESKTLEVKFTDVAGSGTYERPFTLTGDGNYSKLVIYKPIGDTACSFYAKKSDGTWVLLGTRVAAWLAGSVRIGCAGCTFSATNTITAVCPSFYYAKEAAYEVDDPTALLNRTFRVRAQDTALNQSSFSETITASPLTSSPNQNEIKYRPGFYVQPNFILPYLTDPAWSPGGYVYEFVHTICALPQVDGCNFIITDGVIEKLKGDYSTGIAIANQLLTWFAALPNKDGGLGKPFTEHIWSRRYNPNLPTTPQTSTTRAFADWQIDEGRVSVAPNPAGFCAVKIWEAGTMDLEIARYAALGASLNGRKWFEGTESSESSLDTRLPTFTDAGYWTQMNRHLDAALSAWPNTMKRYSLNWTATFNQATINLMKTFFGRLAANPGCSTSGPDQYVNYPGGAQTFGELITRGVGVQNYTWIGIGSIDYGAVDHRGKIGIAYHDEYISSGYTKEQLQANSFSVIMNTHLVKSVQYAGGFDQNGGVISANNGWDQVYPYYAGLTRPFTAVACPTAWLGRCSPTYGT